MSHKLALIGFGVVGQGLAEIIRDKGETLRQGLGLDLTIVAISDAMKGSIYHPDGLDIEKALQVVKESGSLNDYPDQEGLIRGWDSFQTIKETNADTIVEVTFTDVKTGQPAIDHCKAAFECGKNVVKQRLVQQLLHSDVISLRLVLYLKSDLLMLSEGLLLILLCFFLLLFYL